VTALPVEVLLGLYLGLLTGVVPALVAWSLGFTFKYFTGISVPALAVVALGVAIAGANGGLLALVDPSVTASPDSVRVVVAILVVMMMSLYAHAQGDRVGGSLPRRLSYRRLRERGLAADVVELVGGRGQVHVTVAGEVADIEGYPPLPAAVRTAIGEGEWPFPVDLPLAELERRLEDRLRTRYDLAEVDATIDERGVARLAAAPGANGLSARVPAGRVAVSIEGLLPTGLAPGDAVTVGLGAEPVSGTVVSARSNAEGRSPPEEPSPVAASGDEPAFRSPAEAATADGGDGRVTVAVRRRDAEALLRADRGRVVVTSRGVRVEFELLAVLRRAGARLRKLVVSEGGELAGRTLASAAVRDADAVEVLAVRRDGDWTVAPSGHTRLDPGTEAFVVGTEAAVEAFARRLG